MINRLLQLPRSCYWMAEAALTGVVLLLLLMLAWPLSGEHFKQSTGPRYQQDAAVAVVVPSALGHELSQQACSLKGSALPQWRQAWCGDLSPSVDLADWRAPLRAELAQAQQLFRSPLQWEQPPDATDWALARAGLLPLNEQQPSPLGQSDSGFATYYGLQRDQQQQWYSPALQCALQRLIDPPAGWSAADSALMAAAILRGASPQVAQGLRQLPAVTTSAKGCAQLQPAQAMRQAVAVMAKAQASVEQAQKAERMLSLPSQAGWILLLYTLLALLLLNFTRAPRVPLAVLTGAGLILWAGAGWLSGVLLPASWSLYFWWWMAAAGALCLAVGWRFPGQPRPLQYVTSRLGFPVFVLLLGLGWLVLLDLSTHAHEKNRYLALYQQRNLLVAFILISLLPAWRFWLLRRMADGYARLLLSMDSWQWLKIAGVIAAVVVVALMLQHQRQFTSELWRLWLLFGVGYFLCMRSSLLLRGWRDWIKPLLLMVLVPVIGLIVTDDNGPLLVTLYGGILLCGALLAAALRSERGWPWYRALPAGLGLILGLALVLTAVLFSLGQWHARTRERLASVFDPYSAANDQMALIHNFRASIPGGGYGFGYVPWCGDSAGQWCGGVPAQIQSDYTLTALQGVLGSSLAMVLLLGLMLLWWMRLLFNQQRSVVSRPQLGGMCPANVQSWVSWMCLLWLGLLLFQLFITVAANMGFFPLTGITFPFVSYGAMSLWANTLLLALSVNLIFPASREVRDE